MKARQGGTAAAEEALPFEDALARLEALVDRLEQGDLPLEEALAAFEQGVRLTRSCAAQLAAAEQRIEQLVEEGGEWMRRPLEPGVEAGTPGPGPDDEDSDDEERD